MTLRPRTAVQVLGALAAGGLLLRAPARADDLVLRYEPLFTLGEQRTVDATGAALESSSSQWDHVVNARYSRRAASSATLLATATYERVLGQDDAASVLTERDGQRLNTHVQLALGPRELNLTPFFDRTESSQQTLSGGVRAETPRQVQRQIGAFAMWTPADLPALTVRMARTDQEVGGGRQLDATNTEASLEARYPLERLELRYRLRYENPVDHLRRVDTVGITNIGYASYSDRLLGGRISLFGYLNLADQRLDTKATGAGGTVETRQAPVAGLSALETPPATAASIALSPTPALVDGDRTASAGLNIGFSRTAAGDVVAREIGVQFSNALTPVSEVYVWVDRSLPAGIAGAFSWAAYRSDDNLIWAPVALAGPVTFGAFDNRFEIPIERTQARYLKVVTRPLPPGTTLDPRFADVLVTEVELLDVVPAADVVGRTGRTTGSASASMRAKLLADRHLFYDLRLNVTHTSSETATRKDSFETYDVTNGLSYDQPLGRMLSGSARLERTDTQQRSGHQASTRFSAALAATPLATLTATAAYDAQLSQTEAVGDVLSNSVRASLQALPYEGVALQATAQRAITSLEGQTLRSHSESAIVSVTPHPALVLNGAYSNDSSRMDATGVVRSGTRRTEGTVIFAPLPAIYLSGALGTIEQQGRPRQRVSSVAANVRPFPSGTVFVSFNYSETYDSAYDTRTRTWGPYLRWNVAGATYLETAYTVQDSTGVTGEARLALFTARLAVSL